MVPCLFKCPKRCLLLSFKKTHLKKIFVLDCIFLMYMFECLNLQVELCYIFWFLFFSNSRNWIFLLLKLHNSFLLLLNIPIFICSTGLFQGSMFAQMLNRVFTAWCPFVSITLSRAVMFTYLKLWRLHHAFIRAGKNSFFWKSSCFSWQAQGNAVHLVILFCDFKRRVPWILCSLWL